MGKFYRRLIRLRWRCLVLCKLCDQRSRALNGGAERNTIKSGGDYPCSVLNGYCRIVEVGGSEVGFVSWAYLNFTIPPQKASLGSMA